MAWTTELPAIMRVLLNDMDTPYTFSDARLQLIVAAAAHVVNDEIDGDYTVTVASSEISPDPTTSDPKDDGFINLVCLKAACLLERSAVRRSVNRGVLVKDGGTTVDARDKAKAALEVLGKNYCSVYADAKRDYFVNRPACAAIMGPIRLYARDYYRPCSDHREE